MLGEFKLREELATVWGQNDFRLALFDNIVRIAYSKLITEQILKIYFDRWLVITKRSGHQLLFPSIIEFFKYVEEQENSNPRLKIPDRIDNFGLISSLANDDDLSQVCVFCRYSTEDSMDLKTKACTHCEDKLNKNEYYSN